MTAKPHHDNFISDVLITFNEENASFPSRVPEAIWNSEVIAAECRFWLQPPGMGWTGYPLRSCKNDDKKIWLIGELYGVGSEEASEALLKEIVAGQRPARELNGHFLLLVWDAPAAQWRIWTSRFATVHAYYAFDGTRAALGTFFPAVAAAASNRRLDWEALTGFFSFGFFPRDKTFFEDVRILPPASCSTFDSHGRLIDQQRYWHWWHNPNPARSYNDTVAEFAQVFTEVMADLTYGDRIAIPISGGLDSRSTVAALTPFEPETQRDNRFWAYSYGYSPDSVETGIARAVAQARRLPFQAFTIQPYLFDRLDLVLRSVEGFQDVTQCRQAAVVDEIRPRADYLIAAHWGDVWLDDMGLVDQVFPASADKDIMGHAFKKMLKGGREWLVEHLCRPHLGNIDSRGLLHEMLRPEVDKLSNIGEPDFRMKAFKTDQWSFRWTEASLRMFQAATLPRLPFYDNRIADFFCTVPSHFVKARRLQIDYLKRFAPDLARITWQVYDTNLYRYQHFHTWLLPKRALKKAWRILSAKQIIERNWEVQFLSAQGRQGLEHWLLRPGLKVHEFVAATVLKDLLEKFYYHPLEENRGYTISMLLTLSAWIENYG